MGDRDEPGEALLALYDRALPVVYGYLVDRCGDRVTAEDLAEGLELARTAVDSGAAAERLAELARFTHEA